MKCFIRPVFQEEELEQEKQQQMFLLQELEEQKVRLEQMLLEAQHERERLKAAATRQRPVCSTSISTGLPADVRLLACLAVLTFFIFSSELLLLSNLSFLCAAGASCR